MNVQELITELNEINDLVVTNIDEAEESTRQLFCKFNTGESWPDEIMSFGPAEFDAKLIVMLYCFIDGHQTLLDKINNIRWIIVLIKKEYNLD